MGFISCLTLISLHADGMQTFAGYSLADQLSRVAYRQPGWYTRFVKSQRCYVEARQQLFKNAAESIVPDLESYVEQRRDASGWRMALDMVQYAGDASIPDAFLGEVLFGRLHDHACDIAAWSEVGLCSHCFCIGLLSWMFPQRTSLCAPRVYPRRTWQISSPSL